jgi:hypothetical protein
VTSKVEVVCGKVDFEDFAQACQSLATIDSNQVLLYSLASGRVDREIP